MKGHLWQLIGHVTALTLPVHVFPDVPHQHKHSPLTFCTFPSSIISAFKEHIGLLGGLLFNQYDNRTHPPVLRLHPRGPSASGGWNMDLLSRWSIMRPPVTHLQDWPTYFSCLFFFLGEHWTRGAADGDHQTGPTGMCDCAPRGLINY